MMRLCKIACFYLRETMILAELHAFVRQTQNLGPKNEFIAKDWIFFCLYRVIFLINLKLPKLSQFKIITCSSWKSLFKILNLLDFYFLSLLQFIHIHILDQFEAHNTQLV